MVDSSARDFAAMLAVAHRAVGLPIDEVDARESRVAAADCEHNARDSAQVVAHHRVEQEASI
jgi:hypothetical protein